MDLSRASLLAARRRIGATPSLAPVHWVQGAGEQLPIKSHTIDGAVAFGNIVSFASEDGPVLLKELARVTKTRGRFLVDFPTPVGAVQEFFHMASRHRLLPRVLRRRRFYLVDQVLETAVLPFAPHRLTQWEFKFYTVETAREELRKAGFDVVDIMSVGPVARMDDRVIAVARRDRRSWNSLLEVEERVGRRPGVRESGDGFLVCAVRKSR